MDTKKEKNLDISTSELEKKKKRCKIYALVAFVVLVLAIAAFYFLYFIKTPEYSLNEIRTAAQTKNVVLLEERVDLKSVYSSAFDDYVASNLDSSNFNNPLAIAMVKFLKPTVIDTLVERTKESVKNGQFAKKSKEIKTNKETTKNKEITTNKETTKNKEESIKENPTNEIKQQKTNKIKDFKFNGFKKTIVAGNTAVVSAEVLDKKSNKVIVIDFKMTKLNDGTWQLVKIDNFKEILKEIDIPSFNELTNR